MSDVSSSKFFASENNRFAFWVELVAADLFSAGYFFYMICELFRKSEIFTLCATKDSGCGSSYHKKEISLEY